MWKGLEIEQHLRGTIAGFMMPQFIVDLPGGGGKRLMSSYEEYDRTTGISKYRAPGLLGEKGTTEYKYYDPAPEASMKQQLPERHYQHQGRHRIIPEISQTNYSSSERTTMNSSYA